MRGKALGRGLSALIPGADDAEGLQQIPLGKIRQNPFQPRENMDLESLKEMADSIRKNGIIQPLAVCRGDGDGYILISGARRLKAADIAGLKTVPAVLLEVESDAQLLELALVENLQREDLNPIELAKGYQRLMEECGLTQEEVALKLSKGRPTITNTLRLLKLPDVIKEGLIQGKISAGHAKAMAAMEDEEHLVSIYRRVIKEGLNVRQLEKIISRGKHKSSRPKAEAVKSSYIEDLENRLRMLYGTKINILPRKKGGVIEISYFAEEELERLIEMLEAGGEADM